MKTKVNIHDFLDIMGASIGSLVYRNSRVFADSLESPSLHTTISKTVIELDQLQPNMWHKVTADGPAGKFDSSYFVYQWYGINSPTLLYIHGSGEQPKDFNRFSDNSFQKLFTKEFNPNVNLILLIAPFHEGSQKHYINMMGSLKNYVGMLATTTALLEALAKRLQQEGCHDIFAAGFSLGGWVVNLHRTFFGEKICRYIPICAGTRPEEVFLSSHYRKLTAESARAKPLTLKNTLNFEQEFQLNLKNDCFPLLFRYDRLVEFNKQRFGYDGMNLQVIDKGHFTGQQSISELRRHVINSIS